jgi:hypothetical protein
MKAIPLEQLGERVSKMVEGQEEHEAIQLTKDSSTVALLLRVPVTMKDTEPDFVLFSEGPSGRIFVFVEAKHASQQKTDHAVGRPVFGAGRGTFTEVSEDDEHLKDFKEYME